MTSQEIGVRLQILKVIAIKKDKHNSKNKLFVSNIKIKLHLFVFKKGAYKQYMLLAAIQKFITVFDQSN
jgi:hypothetical protein